jgi:hypothetical protein
MAIWNVIREAILVWNITLRNFRRPQGQILPNEKNPGFDNDAADISSK